MKRIFTMMVCLAAMLLSVSSAKAVYTHNVQANADNGSSSGFWNVLFSTTDCQTWNVVATPGSMVPNGFVNQILLVVYDGVGDVNLLNPVTMASVGPGSTSGGTWIATAAGGTAQFSTGNTSARLQPTGTPGSFTGTFTLASPTKVGTLEARLTGGTKSWYGTTAYTPEMPGGVLLLAALLPLGLMLRKKGAFQKNVV